MITPLSQPSYQSTRVFSSDLPSPSCVPESQELERQMDSFPFDIASLEEASLEMGYLFSLGHEEGFDQVKKIIIDKAQDTHQKKFRSSRTKLEMERRRLEPITAPISGPRKRKSKVGVLTNGIQ
ncbi:unnamed protein product [Linum trigynum]|uniref:Uncharacterized protein n=1 Tax=Linum trigynum TaxID=586398 RepID=A0AAV2FI86_9ROSI